MMLAEVHGDARRTVLHGAERVRSYGEVDAEYSAATGGAALIDRGADPVFSIEGKQAERMLLGVVSGVMPAPGDEGADGVVRGLGTRHTVLTPKGKMVADMALLRLPDRDDVQRYRALVPAAAREGLLAHLGRYLPPRFARVTDRSAECARLTVAGPGAAACIRAAAPDSGIGAEELDALGALGWMEARIGGESVHIVRSTEVDVPAFDLVLSAAAGPKLWARLTASGATPMGAAAWEILRIEAGSPLYGAETDDATIPTEAGLEEVAIDHTKGCYTGQEVIVRIRDRGQVARRLRRLLLGDLPTPSAGTELFVEGRDRAAAEVRSAAWSPRFEQTIALAFVRRGVWPEGEPQPDFRLDPPHASDPD